MPANSKGLEKLREYLHVRSCKYVWFIPSGKVGAQTLDNHHTDVYKHVNMYKNVDIYICY